MVEATNGCFFERPYAPPPFLLLFFPSHLCVDVLVEHHAHATSNGTAEGHEPQRVAQVAIEHEHRPHHGGHDQPVRDLPGKHAQEKQISA